MKSKVLFLFLAALCCVRAAEPDVPANSSLAGFAASVLNVNNGCQFNLFQVHGVYNILDLYRSSVAAIHTGCGGDLGWLRDNGPSAFLAHADATISTAFLKERIAVIMGTGPAMITRFRYPNRNIGSYLQFISFVGLRINPIWRIGAGVRFQHMSNANLGQPNPGLNLLVVELNYFFLRHGAKK